MSTLYVADQSNDAVYAFDAATRTRDPAKDLSQTLLRSVNRSISPTGITTDGTTIYVADQRNDVVLAFNAATRTRDSSKDLSQTLLRSAASNIFPDAITTDGETIWMLDKSNNDVWAFNIANRTRDSSKDFSSTLLRSAHDDLFPNGITTNGATMWVLDAANNTAWAFNLAARTRDSSKDLSQTLIQSAASNISPTGITTNGATIWVLDGNFNNRVWAFNAAARTRDSSKDLSQTLIQSANSNISPTDIAFLTPPPTAPSAPSAPTATPSTTAGGEIGLSWTAVSGATSYDVQHSTTSTFTSSTTTTLEDVSTTGTTISDLTPGTTYYFRVRATNAGGDSAYSSSVSAVAPNAPVPDIPLFHGETRITGLFHGTIEITGIHRGSTLIWEKTARGPAITNFGASSGSGTFQTLTINNNQIPISPTIRGTVASTVTSWTLYRVTGPSTRTEAAVGGAGITQVHFTENMRSDFKPPSSGWRYVLEATDATGTSHAECLVRVVTAPSLTVFRATVPSVIGRQPTQQAVVFLTWTGTEGDPTSTWALTQAGSRTITHLPTHLSAAQGRATGLQRTRVQVSATGGGTTTLTLTATNEAGSVNRSVVITWPS